MQANRQRSRSIASLKEIFSKVNCLLTPGMNEQNEMNKKNARKKGLCGHCLPLFSSEEEEGKAGSSWADLGLHMAVC